MAASRILAVVLAAAAATTTLAAPHDHAHVDHHGPSLGQWYHDESHPATKLFARAPSNAPVGSTAWYAQYPDRYGVPSQNEADIPAVWLATYKAAKAAGKIPDLPVTNANDPHGFPYYGGLDPMGPQVCSSTPKCRTGQGDIWDAPTGTIGISFDDGPWQGTKPLLDFLETNKITATHYVIGRNVAQQPQDFQRMFQIGNEVAVHTWSHPQMTTQTDLGVLVELGWTIQIIHDLTGGRVPKFWRPPTGDNDNRVRAIAREVFGLSAIMWNQDTEDWSLDSTQPVYTIPKTEELLHTWLTGPKTPGLIILEHELTPTTVGIFMNTTWPGVQANGWKPMPIAQMLNTSPFQNAAGNTGAVTPQDDLVPNGKPAGGAPPSSSSTSSSTSAPAPSSPSSSSSSAPRPGASSGAPASASVPGTSAPAAPTQSTGAASARAGLSVLAVVAASALLL